MGSPLITVTDLEACEKYLPACKSVMGKAIYIEQSRTACGEYADTVLLHKLQYVEEETAGTLKSSVY